jgi:putative FmdB family regulatory protein
VLTPQREESVPTYQYACTECGERTEVVQKFSDEPLTVCRVCEGRLRKVFSPVGIVFKGSGFYRTDSRNGANGKAAASAEAGSADGKPAKDDSGSASGDKKTAGDSNPAASSGSRGSGSAGSAGSAKSSGSSGSGAGSSSKSSAGSGAKVA